MTVHKIWQKILTVQSKLKVGKTNRNEFAKFNYRSFEDICEAIKPILAEQKLLMVMEDKFEVIKDILCLTTTAKIIDTEDGMQLEYHYTTILNSEKKGMDIAQAIGATSSYARKYCLNGIFLNSDEETELDAKGEAQKIVTPTIIKVPSRKEILEKALGIPEAKITQYIEEIAAVKNIEAKEFYKSITNEKLIFEIKEIMASKFNK